MAIFHFGGIGAVEKLAENDDTVVTYSKLNIVVGEWPGNQWPSKSIIINAPS